MVESGQRMEAGFGRSDITPRVGIPLAGFGPYLNRQASGVEAALYCRAAFLQSGKEACLVLSLELCGLSRPLLQRVREEARVASGLPEDRIFIATTHTHSGPQTVGHIGWGHPDDLYLETLPQRAAAAVVEARKQRAPVTMRYAIVPVEGIAINREYDRAYDRSDPVDLYLQDDWRPPKPELTDTRGLILSYYREDRLAGCLHSLACHPVVCCEQVDLIHGDFVGLASQEIEKEHPGSVALFLPGALGDVNPCVAHRSKAESLRALGVITRRYFMALRRGLTESCEVTHPPLHSRQSAVRFPRVDWSLDDLATRIAELERELHQPGLTDDPQAGEDVLRRRGMQMVRLSGLRLLRQRMREGEEVNPPALLHGLRLGPVLLLGTPFEVYQATRREIQNRLEGEHTFVLSLVNGAEGYAPDPESFERQGYAAEFVPLLKGDPPHQCLHPLLVESLVALAGELGEGSGEP